MAYIRDLEKDLIYNYGTDGYRSAIQNITKFSDGENLYSIKDNYAYHEGELANVATSGDYNDLINKPTIPAAQVQSDWNATSGMGVILNKPTLSTVATSGSYTDLTNTPTIPVVDQTYNRQSANAQSGVAVASAIDSALSSVYKPAGSSTFANLPTPASRYEGYVFNISDAFTTTSDFVEGAGNSYPAGTNIVCISTRDGYKWDVLAGFIDLSGYATIDSLANVATSGDYADLTNTPTIPAAQVQSDWNATSGMGVILNKPTIPTVDQTYNALSTNAQSGVAVAEAISNASSAMIIIDYTV